MKSRHGWTLISAGEALRKLKVGARALDVRSPKEFSAAAVPGFTNVPILDDDHRHQVGIAYKEKGQREAIALGTALVAPIKDSLTSTFRSHLAPAPPDQRLLICWRGGLRSQIASEWLADQGILGLRVQGGYKALRRLLLEDLERPRPFLVLGGRTGAGKSDLLRAQPPDVILDLEGLAVHRGSAFGGWPGRPQPRQQTFENAIAFTVWESSHLRVVEAESQRIGACTLPHSLRQCMLQGELVILEADRADRARRIFMEYVCTPLKSHAREDVRERLKQSVRAIARALGGARTQDLLEEMDQAFAASANSFECHESWIETLLRDYYDPRYDYALQRTNRRVHFRGDYNAVQDYLTGRLGRGRP
ncbi:MAG: tRNA 2-selenouridine(34) synthase MnmH [Bdellovibrionales bacterium]